jgi:hypothetical protein
MPFFRKKTDEFPAIKFTGDNYKVVETWGTAFGVKVCQFLTEPDVPYVCVEEHDEQPLWTRLPVGHYVAKQTGMPPFTLEADWFETVYEEAE